MSVLSRREAGTSTLDLALRVLDFLSRQSEPMGLGEIALEFSASKATVYRHLVTLQRHGYVRQDHQTGRYEVGVKLLVLGEAVRARFDVVANSRPALMSLRDHTGQAVTLCTMIDDELVVLELVQGRTIIEFATRPGTRLALHASAHGKVWLAFGPLGLLDGVLKRPLPAWTPHTISDPTALRLEVQEVRGRGWATAPDQVITGVNTIAAPILDHRGQLVASIAIVGSTQFIAAEPDPVQCREVVDCAARISRDLGWKA
jgi:DNA-binding IclR family transcriptional regulator